MGNWNDIAISRLAHLDRACDTRWARSIRLLKEWRSHWQDTDVSVPVLLQSLPTQTGKVEHWREKVLDEIRGWAGDRRSEIKQGSFWKAYEAFDRNVDTLLSASSEWVAAIDLSQYQIGELDLSTRVPKIDVAKAFDLAVVDGQQRWQIPPSAEVHHFLLEKSVRALSSRAIRTITRSVVDEIEKIDVLTVARLLKVAKEALSRGIDQRVRWRTIFKKTAHPLSAPEMIRENVLGFQLRTGNPPPFDPAERRAGAVGVPAIFFLALKVMHEQVFGQGNRRDFHMAVYARSRSTSLRFKPQAYPPAGRSNQPAGRQCLWSNIQLAKGTGTSWHPSRRQMVSDLRLGDRAGGFPNKAGAAIGLEKGIR